MPREFVCPLKEHTPTLNAAFFREIEVVLARLAVAVRVICQFPLRQRLDNLRMWTSKGHTDDDAPPRFQRSLDGIQTLRLGLECILVDVLVPRRLEVLLV